MTELSEAHGLNPERGTKAELELRIELLEEDVDYLCREVRLANLREHDLRRRLHLSDETDLRDPAELRVLFDLLPSEMKSRN